MIFTPVIVDLIVTFVIVIVIGALEIVIAIVTLDMTHEDSENLLGEAQTFSLERATPISVIDPCGEGSGVFMCDYLLDKAILLIF